MTDLRKAAEMALEALQVMKAGQHQEEKAYMDKAIEALRTALAQTEQEYNAGGEPVRNASYWKRQYDKLKAAQPDNTSDSATRSADSAESFCKQELHNLMSVAGRMALELECLLLDTENLSVVSKWWDTGMEALQAYRHYVWSVTHGKDGENFCDTHCVHTDHHPDCKIGKQQDERFVNGGLPMGGMGFKIVNEVAQPEQESNSNVVWKVTCSDGSICHFGNHATAKAYSRGGKVEEVNLLDLKIISEPVKGDISEPVENLEPVAFRSSNGIIEPVNGVIIPIGSPLYTAPPKREWVGLTDDEIDDLDIFDYDGYGFPNNLARAIEAKLKSKNGGQND